MASICASEVVLVFVNLVAGVILKAIVLAIILSWQSLRPDRREGRAVLHFALVTRLHLLSLTLPLPALDGTSELKNGGSRVSCPDR